MKSGRVCHALCVGGGNIYALGGRSKNPPGTVGSNVTDGKVIDSIEKYAVQVSSRSHSLMRQSTKKVVGEFFT